MSNSTEIIVRAFFLTILLASNPLQAAKPANDVSVVNTPDVNVTNVPEVIVANEEDVPIPVRSRIRHTPVLCVVPVFQESGLHDARCVSPTSGVITPVPAGFYLAITDVIATSQQAASTVAQAVVRVSSRSQGGVQFGAGVPMILKPGETQSLHYQSPHQVLPAGRIPTASVSTNFGDVFPVEVNFTGYLVASEELGL